MGSGRSEDNRRFSCRKAAQHAKREEQHASRDGAKETADGKEGLLIGRREYGDSYDLLLTGDRKHCLADSVAHGLEADQDTVRHGIGEHHSFERATAYVAKAQPDVVLANASASFMNKGGIEMALLNRPTGRLILSMAYMKDDVKLYHCAYFDAGYEWTRETLEGGVVCGRGVLKDNQADVLPCLAEASDSASKEAARAFFQKPYACEMRIKAVYELVQKSKVRGHKRQRVTC